MFNEYIYLVYYFILSALISSVIYLLSALFTYNISAEEKNSTYECGFTPFSDARSKFDVKYYLVAILFIVFDLEIAFFFPWASVLAQLWLVDIVIIIIFIIFLLASLFYEWLSGALDWSR